MCHLQVICICTPHLQLWLPPHYRLGKSYICHCNFLWGSDHPPIWAIWVYDLHGLALPCKFWPQGLDEVFQCRRIYLHSTAVRGEACSSHPGPKILDHPGLLSQFSHYEGYHSSWPTQSLCLATLFRLANMASEDLQGAIEILAMKPLEGWRNNREMRALSTWKLRGMMRFISKFQLVNDVHIKFQLVNTWIFIPLRKTRGFSPSSALLKGPLLSDPMAIALPVAPVDSPTALAIRRAMQALRSLLISV